MEKTKYKTQVEYKSYPKPQNWYNVKEKKDDIPSIKYNLHTNYLYLQIGSDIIRLSTQLRNVFEAIEKSKYILRLSENWDEESAKAIKTTTWERAIKFLAFNANYIYDSHGKVLDTPSITQATDGSIDIYWKTNNYQLLFNIPEEPDELTSYFGENFNTKDQTEGYTSDTSFTLKSCLLNLNL